MGEILKLHGFLKRNAVNIGIGEVIFRYFYNPDLGLLAFNRSVLLFILKNK